MSMAKISQELREATNNPVKLIPKNIIVVYYLNNNKEKKTIQTPYKPAKR